MIAVVVVLVALAAFWLWSKNRASATRHRFVHLLSRTMADRNQHVVRYPTWYGDELLLALLDSTLGGLVPTSLPHSPQIIKRWLNASVTRDDIATFLHHAEALGLSRPDQISLALEFSRALLNLDLVGEERREDQRIALYVVTGLKEHQGQNDLQMTDITPQSAEDYFRRNGATCDLEVPEEHRYWQLTVWMRHAEHSVCLYVKGYHTPGPEIWCYDHWPYPTRGK